MRRTGLGASSLTATELRLLPLLCSYLSFRETGKRLYLSANTIKSQSISIYRKLGPRPAVRRFTTPNGSACSAGR
jgi:DNA-binding CsgD family transcriptional regulator